MWLLKSKTFWGAVLGGASIVVPNWKDPQAWAQGASIVVTAIGLRDAIGKAK